jgi:hypothetical protein
MNQFCVIIDTRRGYSRLGRCLQALSAATSRLGGPPVEIVLIADRVRSRLVSLAEQYGARISKLPAAPRGQRYNTIAHALQADVLVFIDATAEPPPEWFAHAEEALREGQWNAVTLATDRRLAWLERLYRANRRIMALAIRRNWFERVGGFDPDLDSDAERDLVDRLSACHARVMHHSGAGKRTAG